MSALFDPEQRLNSRIHAPVDRRPRVAIAHRALVVALLFALIYNLPNLIYPFFEDTALFATIGHWMHFHLLPYRDLFDQKPPAIYWLTWAVSGTLGDSSLATRAVELGFILVTSLACGLSVRPRRRPWAGALAVIFAGALSSSMLWGLPDRGQVEFYQATLMSLGALFLARFLSEPQPEGGNLLASGFFLALACWLKPQAAIFALGVAAIVTARALKRRQPRRLPAQLLLLAAGAALASGPFLLWLKATGTWNGFVHTLFGTDIAYVNHTPWPPLIIVLLVLKPFRLPGLPAFLILLLMTVGLLRTMKRDSNERWLGALLAVWLVSTALQFWSGHYLFDYQKAVMMPPVAILSALGLALIAGRAARLVRHASLRSFLAVAIVVLFVVPITLDAHWIADAGDFALWTAGRLSTTELYLRHGREQGYFDYSRQLATARFVRAHTTPQDKVQIIGRAAVFYLYVHRRPATPFLITSTALDLSRPGQPRLFNSFIKDLRRSRPSYILVRTDDAFPWFRLPTSLKMVRDDPELSRFLRRSYEYVGPLETSFLLFHRSTQGPSQGE
ncbi:MAG TPA: hypothetical protein VKA53_02220 [Thermoanaerobaculia bacterium]|nr:hypothetical protein [Thermoanaerobaculia bacterium]